MSTDNAGMMGVLDIDDPGTPASARGLDDTYRGGIDVDDHTHDTPPARKGRPKITHAMRSRVADRYGIPHDGQRHHIECVYCGRDGTISVIAPGMPRRVQDKWTREYVTGHAGWRVECSHDFDHVMPWSRGGANHDTNLVPACPWCNVSKGSRTLDEWFDLLADKRRTKLERRVQILERFGRI